MEKLIRILLDKTISKKINIEDAADILELLKIEDIHQKHSDIAIIGMALKMPHANDVDEFWEKIKNGVNCITDFPASRQKDMDDYLDVTRQVGEIKYSKGAYLDEVDKFDYKFFRLSPREASLMSPNQRLFLETAWETIEDSGYGGGKIASSRTGVYLGFSADELYDYKKMIIDTDPRAISEAALGNTSSVIASRISYILDLRGPSITMDTACSSSMVAVHMACQGIKNGECEMALAGGVKINLLRIKGQLDLGIQSPDGIVKTFDDSADGTGIGEGVAAVLLKPLNKAIEDCDHIYAVIKGSSINQDGASIGMTAPNAMAQEDVILNAWKDAGIHPETISYIEAHGTGTKLGDPVEINGIQRAFRRYTDRKQFCGIGSAKTNIGHLDNAAGIAGLIKAVQALRHKQLPPSLHFKRVNRKISFEESPVYVVDRLMDWKAEDNLRRCGVSSFGLSGTNCHVVLEEAPFIEREEKIEEQIFVLTLSAKSEHALAELVERFHHFLEKNEQLSLKDILYVANTGRGHYNYRLAILAWDRQELKENLKRVVINGININYEDIFFGRHTVISASESSTTKKEEVTEAALAKLDEAVHIKTNNFMLSKKKDKTCLKEICSLYVKGARVEWSELYKDGKYYKVSIPTYPFERERCWIDLNSRFNASNQCSQDLVGPLIERYVGSSINQKIYSTQFCAEKHWVLSEHKIRGNAVLVGTAYIEMVLEACKDYMKDGFAELNEIVFIQPLILRKGEQREVQTIIKKEKDTFEFMIASKLEENGLDDEEWIKHVEGKIHFSLQRKAEKCNIEEIKERCNIRYFVPDLSNLSDRSYMEFGPRWRNIRGIHIGEEESLSLIELSQQYLKEFKHYILYPSMLDNALATSNVEEKVMFLPYMYKSIVVYKSLPERFYSYVKTKGSTGDDSETVTFDVTIMDDSGQVLVEIKDYLLKKVHEDKIASFQSGRNSNIYNEVQWICCEPDKELGNFKPGSILLFKDQKGLSEEILYKLKEEGKEIIECEYGEGYKKIDENRYTVSGNKNNLDKLFNDIKFKNLRYIINFQTIKHGLCPNSVQELESSLQRGTVGVFNMVKALLDNRNSGEVDIFLIAECANKVTGQEMQIHPENTALFGLGKVIGQEYPNISCKCIDIDEFTSVQDIIKEIKSGRREYQVAYRKGKRFIEEFRNLNIKDVQDRETDIKSDGVYIITGGAGAIGLETARYLTRAGAANIALINRTRLPSRGEWDEIINKDENTRLEDKLRSILALENEGVRVEIFCADVADEKQMEEVISKLRKYFGRINGVIHSAGIAGAGFIANKSEDMFLSVLSPKIKGTWILDKITENDDLDFFIMFSAGTSVTGAPGQSDYTAANSYMDGFTHYRHKKNKRTLAINWAAWKEVGMAVDYGSNADGVLKAISTHSAIEALQKVLNKDISRVIIGEVNLGHEKFNSEESFPVKLSEKLVEQIRKNKRIASYKANASLQETVKLEGRKSGVYTQSEAIIAKSFGKVLGLKEINICDSLYEMGGDSLIGMNIIKNINKELDIQLEVAQLFQNPTVEKLAECLDEIYSKERVDKNIYSSIQPVEQMEYYPLSSAQKRIFVLSSLENYSIAYNNFDVMVIDGCLDRGHLEKSFKELIKRHESLRTAFELVDGEPVQRIYEDTDFSISYIEGEEGKINEIIENFVQPFNIDKPQLIRAALISLKQDKHILLMDIHHIVYDGRSMGILISELISFYKGQTLPALKVQYKDFAVWQNKQLASETTKKQEAYWRNVFKGELPVLNLPLDFPRPPLQNFEGDRVRFEADKQLTLLLNKLISESGTTMYMVLLAAYNIMLYKYTGQKDIIIGSPIAGRPTIDLENIIGVFINMIPMRNLIPETGTFREFLEDVKNHALKAYENQDYPFEKLIEKLELPRDLSRNPLFDTMLVLLNMGSKTIEVDGLKFSGYEYENRTSKFDLTLIASEKNGLVHFELEYCTKLFRRESVERMSQHFQNILRVIAENPDSGISSINMLSEEEETQILYGFNDTEASYPIDKTIHELFETQAYKNPDSVALVFSGQVLTYSELNMRSNQIAKALVSRGVKSDSIVALITRRSFEMITGIIGILKSGGAYLPIDPTYPAERIRYMLENSKTGVLLTQSGLRDEIDFKGHIMYLDDESSYEIDASSVGRTSFPDNIAYVIYTSGSTGKPKGVMIKHRSVVNFIQGITDRIKFSPEKTILALTTVSFDIFVLETLLSLVKGLKVVIANEEQQMDFEQLAQLIAENHIDMLQVTPSRMQLMLENRSILSILGCLKDIMIGGEAFPASLLEKLTGLIPTTRIFNMYGPTETTVWSTVKELYGVDYVNIGKPIANTQIYIVDKNNQLQPPGIKGELCISGDGLAKGYLMCPELTAEKFVQNPFAQGKLMYRTGDIARWLPNGEVEFWGRMDHQVKIRGFRIELGEIESRLLEHKSIKGAAVTVKEDADGVNKYLCAYIVSDEEIGVQQLRRHLSEKLPEYMVPSYFEWIKELPLTPNGKVYREALPDIKKDTKVIKVHVPPENGIERKLVEIWRELLNTDIIGVDDNFFELGGNSMRLIRMNNILQEYYPGRVKVANIFEYPTISTLARFIEDSGKVFHERFMLELLVFPKEYFIDEGRYVGYNESSTLKFSIDGENFNKIKIISLGEGVEVSDVFICMYAYLIADICGKKQITIHTLTGDGRVLPLNLDFEELRDFTELFKTVNHNRKNIDESKVFKLQELDRSRFIKGKQEVLILFHEETLPGGSINKVCDKTLELDIGMEKAEIICEYNAGRLKEDKMEELLRLYAGLIMTFIYRYDDERNR